MPLYLFPHLAPPQSALCAIPLLSPTVPPKLTVKIRPSTGYTVTLLLQNLLNLMSCPPGSPNRPARVVRRPSQPDLQLLTLPSPSETSTVPCTSRPSPNPLVLRVLDDPSFVLFPSSPNFAFSVVHSPSLPLFLPPKRILYYYHSCPPLSIRKKGECEKRREYAWGRPSKYSKKPAALTRSPFPTISSPPLTLLQQRTVLATMSEQDEWTPWSWRTKKVAQVRCLSAGASSTLPPRSQNES